MIKIFSPAKINLALDVKAPKEGVNFHEIDTIYHKINWGDTLTIKPSTTFSITGNFDCPLEENLIFKAWQLLENPQKVSVAVEKNIPTGGGLGGGSSNAAHFIIGYYQLFKLGAVPKTLIKKLADLGKDIPFFMQPSVCARGTNFGEVITPLNFNFSDQPLWLYFSDQPSDTKQAYQQLKTFNHQYTETFLKSQALNLCGNSFEQNFEQKKYSTMYLTGSGSTWFSFTDLNLGHFQVKQTTLL